MARSKGDGERLPLKRIQKYKVRDGQADWKIVEDLADIKLSKEIRNKIHFYTTAYSSVGPLYSPKQSVLAKDARSAIESWLLATNKLTLALTPTGADLGDFMPCVDAKRVTSWKLTL